MRQRLGKTLTAYAEFVNLRSDNHVNWFFVICPNSLKEQWKEAIEEVNLYETVFIYESSNKIKYEKFFSKKRTTGVIIINYESMQSFMDEKGWMRLDPLRTYCAADESTRIKDPTTKAAKACLELAGMCAYTRVLTGKPTANSNADIWAQLKFINATQRNYYQHKYYFCIHGGFMGRTVVKNINTEILQKEMANFVYIAPDRYIKGFEKVYEPLRRVQLAANQLKQYKKMEDELVLSISEETEITAPIALVKYLRLQQISSGIAGDIDGKQHNLIDPFHNPRIRMVCDILENEVENKVIIACRFKQSIYNLTQVLTAHQHKVSVLTGNMTGEDIEIQKRKFNEGDANILIAQLQVLSFGHTLPGPDENPCDSMIFYENDFSLINRMQCESRPEKMERSGAISYYDFYASKLDKYIMSSLRKKEESALALMNYSRSSGLRPEEE